MKKISADFYLVDISWLSLEQILISLKYHSPLSVVVVVRWIAAPWKILGSYLQLDFTQTTYITPKRCNLLT